MGGSYMMIHVCHGKQHLPSDKPDQIQKGVTQIRNFMKNNANLFSTEQKMMEQYSSFGGLDTCNQVEFGNFDESYILRFDN